jgi:hypothetical protein
MAVTLGPALRSMNADERDSVFGAIAEADSDLFWDESRTAELWERAEKVAAIRLYAADGPRWTAGRGSK